MPRAYSSTARQPPSTEVEQPVTVLVTGFGPFLQSYPRNSSWEIATHLPAIIPASPSNPTPIHIAVHHEPIRVAYAKVIGLVPRLLPPASKMYPKPDVVLHIGLAAGRQFYTLEKGAHGRGYGKIPDVDGQRFEDEEAERNFPTEIFPGAMRTSFDVDDVLGRWKADLGMDAESNNTPDVRLSPDAGNFMCGFIYYNSLAHFFAQKEDERPVAFLHVPDLSGSEEKLATGTRVAVSLIKALVASRKSVGVVDEGVFVDGESEEGKVARMDVNFA